MATPKLLTMTILAATSLAVSTPALADWKTKSVDYGDLDLSSAKGQERLMTRVKQAVKQVCGSPRAFTIKERADRLRCEVDATARAMPEAQKTIAAYVDSRRLAAREGGAVVGN